MPTAPNIAAFVNWLMSLVTSKNPCAPLPLACTTRSGTRSRLKCCIFWTVWASCNTVGPLGPTVSECASLATGLPVSVVVRGRFRWSLISRVPSAGVGVQFYARAGGDPAGLRYGSAQQGGERGVGQLILGH